MKQLIKEKSIKILYVFSIVLLALPSYIFIIKNKTFLDEGLELKYLLVEGNATMHAISYMVVISLIVVGYLLILKYRKKLFENIKGILIFILIVSSILVFTIPFFSHDVLYYMGVGRLTGVYKQNPYYVSIKEFVDNNSDSVNLDKDKVLECGYKNYWSYITVIYGPVWTLICTILGIFSFGNAEICILLFKVSNLIIHIINCYLIYKITKRKLIVLIYGLNPFILLESIVNVHNDIFMVFFILLVFYELLKRKNILKSILFLAMATGIKYYTILFLPFIILYHFRNESTGKRFFKCIKYGGVYVGIVIISYLLFFRDFNVLNGIFKQQNKLSKSLCSILYIRGYGKPIIDRIMLSGFCCYYVIKNIFLMFNKRILVRKEMKQLFYYLFIFLFVLITNFQPWYILWLMPLIVFLQPKKIRLIIQITISALYGYMIFILYGDTWPVGTGYSLYLLYSIMICAVYNNVRLHIKKAIKKNEIRLT